MSCKREKNPAKCPAEGCCQVGKSDMDVNRLIITVQHLSPNCSYSCEDSRSSRYFDASFFELGI